MVTIRLSRFGGNKRPYYHIVVTDSRKPRDGRFLEQVGTYDPARPMNEARVKRDRVDHWVSVGAQISTTVKKVLREQAKAAAPAA